MEHFVLTNMFAWICTVFAWIRTVFAHSIIGCAIRYPKIGNLRYPFISYKIMALTCSPALTVSLGMFHYITVNATSYNAGTVINAPNNIEMISAKLKITLSFMKRIRVSNACITEFRILILLGDE